MFSLVMWPFQVLELQKGIFKKVFSILHQCTANKSFLPPPHNNEKLQHYFHSLAVTFWHNMEWQPKTDGGTQDYIMKLIVVIQWLYSPFFNWYSAYYFIKSVWVLGTTTSKEQFLIWAYFIEKFLCQI